MSQPLIPRLSRRHLIVLGALGLGLGGTARAAQPPINTLTSSFFGGRSDTAINGYDTVAYFTVGQAVKGQDAYEHSWMGAKWKFSSQANLDLFKADPGKYAPQYGGYCAFGVAKGSLVKVEPDQFTVRDGKLYLNFDAKVQKQWLQDPARFIQIADERFPKLLQQ